MSYVVFAIYKGDGKFVDRGGRTTRSVLQIRLFHTSTGAEAFLVRGDEVMWIDHDKESFSDFRVVPVNFAPEIGG